MITRNFGNGNIAQHTLDIYTAAVCREAFTKHVEPTAKWREEMDRVSEKSCADYRKLVREEPRFVPYFRQATPEVELGSLNIGSRPAKRKPKGGIESLRAIPWTFAWTQTRTHLSAWLGVGAGLNVSVSDLMVRNSLIHTCSIPHRMHCRLVINRMKQKRLPCNRCTANGLGLGKLLI